MTQFMVSNVMVSNAHLRHGERFLRFELIRIFAASGLSPEAEAVFTGFAVGDEALLRSFPRCIRTLAK